MPTKVENMKFSDDEEQNSGDKIYCSGPSDSEYEAEVNDYNRCIGARRGKVIYG